MAESGRSHKNNLKILFAMRGILCSVASMETVQTRSGDEQLLETVGQEYRAAERAYDVAAEAVRAYRASSQLAHLCGVEARAKGHRDELLGKRAELLLRLGKIK